MSVTLRNTTYFRHYIIAKKPLVFMVTTTFRLNIEDRRSLQLTGGTGRRYNYRLCRKAWSSTFRARSASTATPCRGR
ncbi:hypothetical protein EMIT0347P_10030 [Pseudomonas sp. IT-347P]